MPNHCWNELYIIGTKSELEKVKKFCKDGKDLLSAKKIIPPPDDRLLDNDGFNGRLCIKCGHISEKGAFTGEAHCEKCGEKLIDGYHWCIQNWGTKWGCYDVELDEDIDLPWFDGSDHAQPVKVMCYRFNTAWSPPTPIIDALKDKFPDVEIHHHAEEAGMGFIEDDGETRDATWYDYNIRGVDGG